MKEWMGLNGNEYAYVYGVAVYSFGSLNNPKRKDGKNSNVKRKRKQWTKNRKGRNGMEWSNKKKKKIREIKQQRQKDAHRSIKSTSDDHNILIKGILAYESDSGIIMQLTIAVFFFIIFLSAVFPFSACYLLLLCFVFLLKIQNVHSVSSFASIFLFCQSSPVIISFYEILRAKKLFVVNSLIGSLVAIAWKYAQTTR